MSRKVRAILTVLGVALSCSATIALLGVSAGLISQVSAIVSTGGNELTVVERSPRRFTFGYLGAMPGSIDEELRRVPGVAWVSPVIIIPAIVTQNVIFLIYGVDPSAPDILQMPVRFGRRLTSDDVLGIVLGIRAAEGMGKKIGNQIEVFGLGFTIVGIYSSGNNLEDGGAMINLPIAKKFLRREDQISLVRVKAMDPLRIGALRDAIEIRLPGVTAITSETFARNRLGLDASVQASWAVSIIALLLSTLAVANTMAMTVLIRTREIGILRAVGWSRLSIIRLFLGEAMVLSFAGGLLGTALGIAGLKAVSIGYRLLPFFSSVKPMLFLEVFCLALLVGLVGGFFPAWQASRLDPVQALRHE